MVELGNMENKFLYKPIDSQVIKDFLDEDTRKDLIEYIDLKWKELYYDKENTILNQKKNSIKNNFQVIKLDPAVGKTYLNLGPESFPKKFWQKAEEHAKKINPNCEFEYVSMVRYSPEFGRPKLRPHFDDPSKVVFILDYQLDGNTEWPIVINSEEYVLKNNECLVFETNLTAHWRASQKFKEGQFLIMLFYSFTDDNKEIPSLQGQSEELHKYMKSYTKDHNEVFGDSKEEDKVSHHTEKLADLFRWAVERDKLKKQ